MVPTLGYDTISEPLCFGVESELMIKDCPASVRQVWGKHELSTYSAISRRIRVHGLLVRLGIFIPSPYERPTRPAHAVRSLLGVCMLAKAG